MHFNFVNWNTLTGDSDSKQLLKVGQDSFLHQHVLAGENVVVVGRNDTVSNVDTGRSLGRSGDNEIRFNLK